MSLVAFNKLTGRNISASDFNEIEWEELRAISGLGQITMECCGARAVLKTSPSFQRFFAHYSDDCATSPETKWHKEVKVLINNELASLGISSIEEKTGMSPNGKKWKADTYFEYNNRKIVIEVQYSYQQLKKYQERQKIYNDSGVECYWLLYRQRYRTLTSSISNYRLKYEYNSRIPESFYGNFSELPMMWADTENGLKIRGVAFIEYPLSLWIRSIIDNKFKYKDFKWFIEGEPLPVAKKRKYKNET